ncbi:MAG: hypothetical protein FWE42_06925, partial [Defluviitaleaceae bacterium]|nr:hypothetical protein [Defluviitaleaceae bacterium]
MKKATRWLSITAAIAALLAVIFMQPLHANAADHGGTPFVPNPRTTYARHFVERSQGQQWFLDAVESILNVHEKSINTITSQADLDT